MARKSTDELAEELSTPTPRVPVIPDSDMLSSGCTIQNLAFSGRPNVGIPKGNYVCLIGGSGSTKSWMTFTWFAEASRNKNFDKYRFIFDNAENGVLWDTERFFGKEAYERIEPPYPGVVGSETVMQFYYHLAINCDRGPCIYVLDSLDALNSDAANDRFEMELEKYESGSDKKIPGSMGMEKARTNSDHINRMVRYLRKNGSILVIISQTRDKPGGYPGQKTSSGGHALKFYAHIRAWNEVKKEIPRTYMGKERNVGSVIQMDIQKNRVCGWEDRINIDFLKNYGIDDIGTSVQWLLDERFWDKPEEGEGKKKQRRTPADADDESGTKGIFFAPEFNFTGRKETLVQLIQDKSLEFELKQLVTMVWKSIIDGATPNRKPKYT